MLVASLKFILFFGVILSHGSTHWVGDSAPEDVTEAGSQELVFDGEAYGGVEPVAPIRRVEDVSAELRLDDSVGKPLTVSPEVIDWVHSEVNRAIEVTLGFLDSVLGS